MLPCHGPSCYGHDGGAHNGEGITGEAVLQVGLLPTAYTLCLPAGIFNPWREQALTLPITCPARVTQENVQSSWRCTVTCEVTVSCVLMETSQMSTGAVSSETPWRSAACMGTALRRLWDQNVTCRDTWKF